MEEEEEEEVAEGEVREEKGGEEMPLLSCAKQRRTDSVEITRRVDEARRDIEAARYSDEDLNDMLGCTCKLHNRDIEGRDTMPEPINFYKYGTVPSLGSYLALRSAQSIVKRMQLLKEYKALFYLWHELAGGLIMNNVNKETGNQISRLFGRLQEGKVMTQGGEERLHEVKRRGEYMRFVPCNTYKEPGTCYDRRKFLHMDPEAKLRATDKIYRMR